MLKDHNAVTIVRLEPAAPRSRVKHSTTEPLRFLMMRPLHLNQKLDDDDDDDDDDDQCLKEGDLSLKIKW